MDALALENARALLGVSEHADDDTINRACRRLSLSSHPDRGGSTAKQQRDDPQRWGFEPRLIFLVGGCYLKRYFILNTTYPFHYFIPMTLASTIAPSRRPARAGPTWDRHHRLHRRFSRPTAATAVTPVAAIATATILAATAGAAERCDVWECLSALSPPV